MELQRDFYVGIVENNIDPNRKGRIKIRVQTLYHNISVDDIPYAYPFAGLAGKEFQVPAIGKLVNVLFLSDDLYSPYYIYSENYNINLQNKLKDLNDEDYTSFSALLYDESTQIYVQQDELIIDQLLNKITINKNSINLELKDKNQTLALGSRKADQNAILGTNFMNWMDNFITEIMNPNSMLDSSGAAISRPTIIKLCQDFKSKWKHDFLSSYIKIINNDDLEKIKRYPSTINNRNDIDLISPPEDNPYQQDLINAIQNQNQISCEELKKSAPSDTVKLIPDTGNGSPKFYNNMMISPQSGIDKSKLIPVWHADSANKINTLHPLVRQYAIEFMNGCYARGIKMIITEAFRTRARQEALQKTGRAARPGFSYHEYGLAIDVSLTNSKDWDTVGEIGQGLGWRWGRYFRNPRREDWHLDMGFGHTTADLKKRLESGYLTSGYVELEGVMPKINNQYSGQNYIASNSPGSNINEPCSDMDDFNSKNDSSKKKNTKGQSDENEGAPNKNDEDSSKQTLPCPVETILNRVMKGEGTNQTNRESGAQSTYDITLSYGKWTPDLVPGTSKPTQPLSSLTIGEIKLVQDQMIKNGAISSAVGKYKLISDTLEVAQKVLKLDDSTIFSPETQDKFGQYLLERRGYSKWMKGNLSDDDFQNNLAKEWASIAVAKDTVRKMKNGLETPIRSGESFYNQKVGTTKEEMKDTLIEAKQEKC